MKIHRLYVLPFLLLFVLEWKPDETELPKHESVKTGIVLDSIGNEVMLMMQDGIPMYYYSNIFTPVCNTGECLPVYVNFYWDLRGHYLRYDQPKGEILTKADHEPFTDEDYRLLSNILTGPDPRYSAPIGVKHGSPKQKGDSQANPTPTMTKINMSKYEMVDGITGSTLPEVKDQFVPGALYTTYTLWGLANDKEHNIRKYTKDHLLKPEYYNHLLINKSLNVQDMVIDHLTSKKQGSNARAHLLINMLDTGSVELGKQLMQKIYWNEYQLDFVCKGLEKKFYSSEDKQLRRMILGRWAYNYITDSSTLRLSENLYANEELFVDILPVFSNKTQWPDGVFENLITELPKLQPKNQEFLVNMIWEKRGLLNNEQIKIVKKKRNG